MEHFEDSVAKFIELFFFEEGAFLADFKVVELIEEFVGFFTGGRYEFCF